MRRGATEPGVDRTKAQAKTRREKEGGDRRGRQDRENRPKARKCPGTDELAFEAVHPGAEGTLHGTLRKAGARICLLARAQSIGARWGGASNRGVGVRASRLGSLAPRGFLPWGRCRLAGLRRGTSWECPDLSETEALAIARGAERGAALGAGKHARARGGLAVVADAKDVGEAGARTGRHPELSRGRAADDGIEGDGAAERELDERVECTAWTEGVGLIADEPGPHGVLGGLSRERVEEPAAALAARYAAADPAAIGTDDRSRSWDRPSRVSACAPSDLLAHRSLPGSAETRREAYRPCMTGRDALLAALIVTGLVQGCASKGGDPDLAGLRRAERAVTPARGAGKGQPPLLIEGEPVFWEELGPPLAEGMGGVIVEEIALERMLRAELEARNTTLATDADARERELLARSLQLGAPELDPGVAMARLRRERGLGERRFDALLRRNAMLRALVAPEVTVTEDQLALAHAVRHGTRVVIRLIAVPSAQEAARIRDELASRGSDLRAAFIEAAASRSTDPSAQRGGLVEPFSPTDPAYEHPVRSMVGTMQEGELSPVTGLASGYALIYLESILPGDGTTLEQVRPDLETLVRARQERLLMDELAADLLARARITALDPSLHASWQARRDATAPR